MKKQFRVGVSAVVFVGILLAGVPAAIAQRVKLSTTGLNFGTVALGQQSKALAVTLSNPDTVHSLAYAIAASGDYSESDGCAGLLEPTDSCTLLIKFKPAAAGTITGIVTLRDDASNSPQLISTTGVGIAPVTASPAGVVFGTVAVGSTSAAKTVTMTNNSTVTATLGLAVSGDYIVADAGTTPCTTSLASKSSCQITVRFTPTISGTISGAVTLTQNVNSTPLLIALSGTGSGGATPPLRFSPATLTFGAVGVGSSSAAKAVTVTNKSSASMNISGFSASGDFKAAAGAVTPCGGALAAGKTCKIAVTFTPTAASAIKGSLTISDNNASVGTQIVDLSGKGTPPLTVSPASLAFGKQTMGTLTQQLVKLTNGLKTSISISGMGVSGQFTLLNQCGASLAAGGSCGIIVTFAPTKTGTTKGELTINANVKSRPIVVPLTGTATGALPRFAYVPNFGDGTVSMYTVSFRTGQLRPNGYVMAGGGPASIAVHPTGQFVYVTSQTENNISAFKVDPKRGTLSPIPGSPFPTGSGPQGLTLDPSGRFAYAANNGDNTVSAYDVNFANGGLSPVPGSPFATGGGPQNVVVDPSGKYAYITNSNDSTVSAYLINSTNGALSPISGSPYATGTFPYAVTVDPSGKFLYVTNLADGTLSAFAIASSDGTLKAITGSPFATGSFPLAVTIDNTGKYLFVANAASSNVSAYHLDPGSGVLTTVSGSPFTTPLGPDGLTVDTTNQYLYIAERQGFGGGNVATFSISPANGALALLQTAPARVEPQAMALVTGPNPVQYTPTFTFGGYFGSGSIDGGAVQEYSIEPRTGVLTPGTTEAYPLGEAPLSFGLDPAGMIAYISFSNTDISGYSVSPSTGALTTLPGAPFPATGPGELAVDSSGRFLFVSQVSSGGAQGEGIETYTISPQTGDPSPASFNRSSGHVFESFSLEPSGRFLYGADNLRFLHTFSINPLTGALTEASGSPNGSDLVFAVAADASGRFLYATDGFSESVHAFAIDITSGALTEVSGSPYPVGKAAVSLTTDPFGLLVYVANEDDNTVSAFSINPSNGGLTPVTGSPFATGTEPFTPTIDPSGAFLYVDNFGDGSISGYAIQQFGVLKPIAGSPFTLGTNPSMLATSGEIH